MVKDKTDRRVKVKLKQEAKAKKGERKRDLPGLSLRCRAILVSSVSRNRETNISVRHNKSTYLFVVCFQRR